MKELLNVVTRGDCLETMRKIDDASVDSIVTDPPYNQGYHYRTYKDRMDWEAYFAWQLEIFVEAERILKPSGSIVWLNYPEIAATMWGKVLDGTKLEPFEIIHWLYSVNTGGNPLRKGTRHWLWFVKDAEQAYVGKEETLGTFRCPNDKRLAQKIANGERPVDFDYWTYEIVRNVHKEKTIHPCQLPLVMVSRIVKMITPVGGIVVDPFGGSGTTAITAQESGRNFITSETDEAYCELIEERLESAVDIFQ